MTNFDKKVEAYLDSITPKWNKEDLIAVLKNLGIEGTDKNLEKFINNNQNMNFFKEGLHQDWFERMTWLVDKNLYKEN